MSHATYDKLWKEAQDTLEGLGTVDAEIQAAKPTKDKKRALAVVKDMFVKYIIIVNKLDQCYDQMVHPQKRSLVKRLLDLNICRVIELRQELVVLENSEHTYYDDILAELGILPMDGDLRVPKYFRLEREAHFRKWRNEMDAILKNLGYFDDESAIPAMSEETATRLLQVHERARQGRMRAHFMREVRRLKERTRPEGAAGANGDITSASSRAAAMRIQKVWRGYVARRKIRRRVVEEMLLIGMLQPAQVDMVQRQRAEQVALLRRQQQQIHQQEYEATLEKEKEAIIRARGDAMREEIVDAARAWIMEFRAATGKFPEFPSDDDGGSAAFFGRGFGGMTGRAESELSRSTGTGLSSRDSKGKRDNKGKRSGSGGASSAAGGGAGGASTGAVVDEDAELLGFKMNPSAVTGEINAARAEYDAEWRHRDESDNPTQSYCSEMLRRDKTYEVEAEIRKTVDAGLRLELERLQAALERDRVRRGGKAKGKVKGKAKAKSKGRRAGKKAKKKKERDLTPDRTLESLYEELVSAGIIRRFPEVFLSDFLGERSLAAGALREAGKDAPPALGDVRQAVLETCVLPLGSVSVRKLAPAIVTSPGSRAVLLAGPGGSGKRMLVHAVCNEVGAVLFDLSAANLVGKYPGKAGLIMLMHLVGKVARLLQPAVIFIDSAEKPFLKKVPKTDKTDPKRLKKDLPKLVKSIGAEDQILIMGITKRPWDCDQKALTSVFGRIFLLPRPDYSTRSTVWGTLLMRLPGVGRQFDTGALARVSDGYTIGDIKGVLDQVLTCKRVLQLRVRPLTHVELVASLARRDPVYREEEDAFNAWYQRTPLGRRHARARELEEERKRAEAEAEAAAAGRAARDRRRASSALLALKQESPMSGQAVM